MSSRTSRTSRGRKAKPASRRQLGFQRARYEYDNLVADQMKAGILSPNVRDQPRLLFSPKGKVHTFVVNNDFTAIVTSTAATVSVGYNFKLSNLVNVTDYTNLFDQWRIAQVTVTFIPQTSSTNANLSAIHSAIDYADSTAAANVSDLEQYSTHQINQGSSMFQRTLAPKYAVASFSAGVFTAFSAAQGWCDTSNPAIEWYGLKVATPPSTGGTATTIAVSCNMVVQCRTNK